MSTGVSAGPATKRLNRPQVRFLGVDVGWYGIAGSIALDSRPVLNPSFRSVFGGPAGPSSEAGNEALAPAEVDAAEAAEVPAVSA